MQTNKKVCWVFYVFPMAMLFSAGHASTDTAALETYGKLPAFERAAISSGGSRIAMIGWLNNVRHVLIVSADNKVQRTFALGDMKVNRLVWAGDDLLLLEYRNTAALGIGFTADKTELTAMKVLPMDGSKPWEIFHNKRLVTGGIRGFYGVTHRDGRWYGYFGGMTLDQSSIPGESPDFLKSTKPVLYEVDLISTDTKMVAKRIESEDAWRDWVVGADGGVASTFEFSSNSGQWKLRNAEREVIMAGQNPKGGIDLLSLGRSAKNILYAREDETTGMNRYYEISQTGGAPTELLPDVAVRRPIADKLTREFIGYETEEDFPRIRFFDDGKNKIVAAIEKAFPDRHVQLQDASRDFTRHIVKTDGPRDPNTWWLVDIKTGTAIILGASYLVPPSQVGPVRMVKYKAADGLDLAGVLTLPPNKEPKNLPVIIFPHGGPAARDYPEFNWWAQAFAAQGYAVFQPNFRGSTGYSTEFEQAGHGQWGRKMQTDISDGLSELAHQEIVDTKRACIMGGSYGGYAALAGVTLQQGLYRCAVSVAGIGDVKAMYRADVRESGQNRVLIKSLRDTLGKFESFDDISPINFAGRADAPILLIHGKDDVVVDYSQSKDMEKALRKAGKPVELFALKGEDHWLSRSDTRLEMLKKAVDFIKKHNPPN